MVTLRVARTPLAGVGLFTTPKETVAGTTVMVEATADPIFSLPPPMAVERAGNGFPLASKSVMAALAVLTRADWICPVLYAGCACLTRAAAPAAKAAAKLVPSTPI